jgi:hypothetical protein
MFQLCFNLNRIHDNVRKASGIANQGRVTANSHHALSSSFHLGLTVLLNYLPGRNFGITAGGGGSELVLPDQKGVAEVVPDEHFSC